MFHYAKTAFLSVPRLLFFYLFKMKRWAKHLDKYPLDMRYRQVRAFIKKISLNLNCEINVFGLENLPKDTNFFIVSNHMSAFDPLPFMLNCEKPLAFVGKKELVKVPILPTAMKIIEADYIDREDLRQSLTVMLKVEEDLKKGNKSWMIFPEGTRIRDQLAKIASFHYGTFRPAVKAGVPIIPAAIYGSFRVLKNKPKFKKYPVSISFLKPLMPEDYKGMPTCDIAILMQQEIQREITYHLRPLDHKIMSEAKDKKYKFTQVL